MLNRTKLVCAIGWLLLMSGCQSYSTPPPRVVAVGCQPTPVPAAMVHGTARAELDPAATGDGDQGLIAVRACQGYIRESYQR